jgi:tetratricopeptide (TPR) repeat protein
VVVEPVAWVSGREELLMTLGALGCLHFHLAARRLSDAAARSRRATACHACAALCCAAACLSNAVGAAIPLLVGALDALTLAGPKFRRILWGSSALWAISLATIVGKKMTPETELAVSQPLVFLDRLLLILNVYWLNLKTLLWPTKLAVQYTAITPRTLAIAEAVLGAFAVGVSFAGLWLLRRRKLTLFGLLWFCLALAPVSQIMPHHIQRADRFLYLPLAGLAAAAAMEVRRLPGVLTERVAVGGTVVAGALGLLLLAILSSGQVQTWRNSLCMWQNCLRVSPDCAVAHAGYADNLAQRGQYAEAIRHYEQAVWRDPKNHEILRGFALLLATCPVETLRDCELAARLANQACRLDKRGDLATVAVLAEVNAQAGRLEMAVAATKKAIAIAQANGEREIAEDLRRRLSLLQNAAAPPRTGK